MFIHVVACVNMHVDSFNVDSFPVHGKNVPYWDDLCTEKMAIFGVSSFWLLSMVLLHSITNVSFLLTYIVISLETQFSNELGGSKEIFSFLRKYTCQGKIPFSFPIRKENNSYFCTSLPTRISCVFIIIILEAMT